MGCNRNKIYEDIAIDSNLIYIAMEQFYIIQNLIYLIDWRSISYLWLRKLRQFLCLKIEGDDENNVKTIYENYLCFEYHLNYKI